MCETVNFVGNATDAEDGDLSSEIMWVSDVDDFLGNGSSIFVSDLSPGIHIINASVSDSNWLNGSDVITITINEAPVVIIEEPPDEVYI